LGFYQALERQFHVVDRLLFRKVVTSGQDFFAAKPRGQQIDTFGRSAISYFDHKSTLCKFHGWLPMHKIVGPLGRAVVYRGYRKSIFLGEKVKAPLVIDCPILLPSNFATLTSFQSLYDKTKTIDGRGTILLSNLQWKCLEGMLG